MEEYVIVINDKAMLNCIVDDLVEQRGYSKEDALEWAKEHGEYIVSDMWEEYTNYIENNSTYMKENGDKHEEEW